MSTATVKEHCRKDASNVKTIKKQLDAKEVHVSEKEYLELNAQARGE